MDWTVVVGRRKTSVARVFIRPASKTGKGSFEINKRKFEEYLPTEIHKIKALKPFSILQLAPADYDIMVNVKGGGITGQAEAMRLGFARCLMKLDGERRPALKSAGLLTRDPRMVERKKYGQPKARKKTQFSKR